MDATSLNRIELIIERVIEPSKALQKPYLKLKPGTIAAANAKIMAFKIKKNKPMVRIINGKVKKVRMGNKIAFKIPKTMAEIAALPKLSISIPKNGNLEIIKKLTAVTSQVRISPVISNHFSPFLTMMSYRVKNYIYIKYNIGAGEALGE